VLKTTAKFLQLPCKSEQTGEQHKHKQSSSKQLAKGTTCSAARSSSLKCRSLQLSSANITHHNYLLIHDVSQCLYQCIRYESRRFMPYVDLWIMILKKFGWFWILWLTSTRNVTAFKHVDWLWQTVTDFEDLLRLLLQFKGFGSMFLPAIIIFFFTAQSPIKLSTMVWYADQCYKVWVWNFVNWITFIAHVTLPTLRNTAL
jgi:hypothetical protein